MSIEEIEKKLKKLGIDPIQDRKDLIDYHKTYNLYTSNDIQELLHSREKEIEELKDQRDRFKNLLIEKGIISTT